MEYVLYMYFHRYFLTIAIFINPNELIYSIYKRLEANNLLSQCSIIPADYATKEQLLSVHSSTYLERLMNLGMKDLSLTLAQSLLNDNTGTILEEYEKNLTIGYTINDINPNDNPHSEYTANVAFLAAGGCCTAIDLVATNKVINAFSLIRPPGHHCHENFAFGFCFCNNVAIAARYAQQKYNIKRIAIIDWDIHAGDGTQDIFLNDPNIMVISIHRADPGFFPTPNKAIASRVGDGKGAGYTVNIPWSAPGQGDLEYAASFQYVILPLLFDFQPELILVSSGFDAAEGDTLGGCHVTPPMYGALTAILGALDPPRGLVIFLEGGYNLDSISNDSVACVQTLIDIAPFSRRKASNSTVLVTEPSSNIEIHSQDSVVFPVVTDTKPKAGRGRGRGRGRGGRKSITTVNNGIIKSETEEMNSTDESSSMAINIDTVPAVEEAVSLDTSIDDTSDIIENLSSKLSAVSLNNESNVDMKVIDSQTTSFSSSNTIILPTSIRKIGPLSNRNISLGINMNAIRTFLSTIYAHNPYWPALANIMHSKVLLPDTAVAGGNTKNITVLAGIAITNLAVRMDVITNDKGDLLSKEYIFPEKNIMNNTRKAWKILPNVTPGTLNIEKMVDNDTNTIKYYLRIKDNNGRQLLNIELYGIQTEINNNSTNNSNNTDTSATTIRTPGRPSTKEKNETPGNAAEDNPIPTGYSSKNANLYYIKQNRHTNEEDLSKIAPSQINNLSTNNKVMATGKLSMVDPLPYTFEAERTKCLFLSGTGIMFGNTKLIDLQQIPFLDNNNIENTSPSTAYKWKQDWLNWSQNMLNNELHHKETTIPIPDMVSDTSCLISGLAITVPLARQWDNVFKALKDSLPDNQGNLTIAPPLRRFTPQIPDKITATPRRGRPKGSTKVSSTVTEASLDELTSSLSSLSIGNEKPPLPSTPAKGGDKEEKLIKSTKKSNANRQSISRDSSIEPDKQVPASSLLNLKASAGTAKPSSKTSNVSNESNVPINPPIAPQPLTKIPLPKSNKATNSDLPPIVPATVGKPAPRSSSKPSRRSSLNDTANNKTTETVTNGSETEDGGGGGEEEMDDKDFIDEPLDNQGKISNVIVSALPTTRLSLPDTTAVAWVTLFAINNRYLNNHKYSYTALKTISNTLHGTLQLLDLPSTLPEWIIKKVGSNLQSNELSASITTKLLNTRLYGVLASCNDTTARQIASITKVMTAILVLKLTDAWDKTNTGNTNMNNTERFSLSQSLYTRINVSARAASVSGTSAKLRSGDSLTILDLLHGMLLPSGNDAATALAEYYGLICEPLSETEWIPLVKAPHYDAIWTRTDPLSCFTAEMNRTAKALGCNDTIFANPHGMVHITHKSCARDVARMVAAAMSDPRFRALVSSNAYECRITNIPTNIPISSPSNVPAINSITTSSNTITSSSSSVPASSPESFDVFDIATLDDSRDSRSSTNPVIGTTSKTTNSNNTENLSITNPAKTTKKGTTSKPSSASSSPVASTPSTGALRKVRWQTTNTYLSDTRVIPGFVITGVKTGITPGAAACLSLSAVSQSLYNNRNSLDREALFGKGNNGINTTTMGLKKKSSTNLLPIPSSTSTVATASPVLTVSNITSPFVVSENIFDSIVSPTSTLPLSSAVPVVPLYNTVVDEFLTVTLGSRNRTLRFIDNTKLLTWAANAIEILLKDDKP